MSMPLIVEGISVSVQGHMLLSEVSLSAPPGITGLIGPNGAGKSTLMRAILGLVPAQHGAARFGETNLLSMARRDRARLAAFVEQTSATDERLTAREVVSLGRIPFQTLWQPGPSAEDERIVDEALETVELAQLASRLYTTLSGGEQQRIQIARALAQQPKLLVLDEPTSHLDIHAQLMVLDILREKARQGMTILVSLHDLNLAANVCDSIAVLHRGRLVAQGSPDTVLSPALLRDVYGVITTRMTHPGTGRAIIAFDTRFPD